RLIRLNGDSGDVHPAALEMHEKQHVVGHQPAQRQHFRREKVGPRQQRQVGPNEGRPCGRALALRRRRHSVAVQNISHRLLGNLKPQIGQRPHYPVIPLGAVLLGHANNQFLNCPLDPGSAWASMVRAIKLARDEPSVPSQNGIRQSGSRYIAECLAAKPTPNLAELRSLGVRELRPPLQLASQDLVLSGEIFIPQQQLLVPRPADVGQDACPLHELPHLPAGSQWAPSIAPNNLTDNARPAHTECISAHLFLQCEFFGHTPGLRGIRSSRSNPRPYSRAKARSRTFCGYSTRMESSSSTVPGCGSRRRGLISWSGKRGCSGFSVEFTTT